MGRVTIDANFTYIIKRCRLMEYQYPVDYTWSTDEIVDVIAFF